MQIIANSSLEIGDLYKNNIESLDLEKGGAGSGNGLPKKEQELFQIPQFSVKCIIFPVKTAIGMRSSYYDKIGEFNFEIYWSK